jgi:hypothetical protein
MCELTMGVVYMRRRNARSTLARSFRCPVADTANKQAGKESPRRKRLDPGTRNALARHLARRSTALAVAGVMTIGTGGAAWTAHHLSGTDPVEEAAPATTVPAVGERTRAIAMIAWNGPLLMRPDPRDACRDVTFTFGAGAGAGAVSA